MWKFDEKLVSNLSNPTTCSLSDRMSSQLEADKQTEEVTEEVILCNHSERRGRLCIASHVDAGRSGMRAYNSFRGRAI